VSELARVSISLERRLLDQFDRLLKEEGYPTRSEAVKDLIRKRLVAREWGKGRDVAGAVALVYDHHHRSLVNRLMEIQHDFSRLIVSVQHIHVSHDSCLEFVIVKGRAAEIRRLVTRLRSAKGLKHHALMMTTTGREIS